LQSYKIHSLLPKSRVLMERQQRSAEIAFSGVLGSEVKTRIMTPPQEAFNILTEEGAIPVMTLWVTLGLPPVAPLSKDPRERNRQLTDRWIQILRTWKEVSCLKERSFDFSRPQLIQLEEPVVPMKGSKPPMGGAGISSDVGARTVLQTLTTSRPDYLLLKELETRILSYLQTVSPAEYEGKRIETVVQQLSRFHPQLLQYQVLLPARIVELHKLKRLQLHPREHRFAFSIPADLKTVASYELKPEELLRLWKRLDDSLAEVDSFAMAVQVITKGLETTTRPDAGVKIALQLMHSGLLC
jgi:hypothetical protein